MSVSGTVVNLARGSLHDGPGVRTVVYFKGCGMRCAWCHNPETHTAAPQLLLNAVRCMGCERCIQTCPGCHSVQQGQHVYDPTCCSACGRCVDVCPTGALELCGSDMTAEELFEQLQKDAHYFAYSGGGVTFSGGECLLQPAFLERCLALCHFAGMHTAVETALDVSASALFAVLPYTDLFMADVKSMDEATHRRYTGVGNARILRNLRDLCAAHPHVLVRVPLIPGVNDDMQNLTATVQYAADCGAQGVELLKYNILAGSKYALLQRSYTSFADRPQTDEAMQALCDALNTGRKKDYVFFTK